MRRTLYSVGDSSSVTGVETLQQAEIIIYRELISEDAEIRAEYFRLFDGRAKVFAAAMAQAMVAWDTLDPYTADGNRIERDRKSTRLNSSHQIISYAVFCLK